MTRPAWLLVLVGFALAWLLHGWYVAQYGSIGP